MENMFSNKTNKKIPQTLSDCIKPDPTATNLHIWAERLENWGHGLFILLIIAGIIVSFMCGTSAADAASDEASAFIGAFVLSALSFTLIAFIEYCSYHVLALLISSLACIVQNTIITADTALFTALQQTGGTSGALANAPLKNELSFDSSSANFVCPQCNHPVHQSESACRNCGQPLGWSSVP